VRAILEHRPALAADQAEIETKRVVLAGNDGVETFLLEEIRPIVDPLAVEAVGVGVLGTILSSIKPG
jgi:hypothetical protein